MNLFRNMSFGPCRCVEGTSPFRISSFAIGVLVFLIACQNATSNRGLGEGGNGEGDQFVRCDDYPAYNSAIGFNRVVPPLGWSQAFLNDGTSIPFNFEDFFCGQRYEDRRILILVIGAAWCRSCARITKRHVNPLAVELTEDLGAEIVYVELQDGQYQAATSAFAYRYLQSLIEGGPGLRVGDADTLIRQGRAMVSRPSFLAQQDDLPVLPAVWVIRKRDMRIIATRELAMQSRPGELPLTAIALNPEGDWRAPPQPNFQNQCREGDEEETAGMTNNVVDNATVIGWGIHSGGVCDYEPDFYTFSVEGPWRLRLQHDISEGDLDLVLWDRETDRAALGEDGRIIGSLTSNNEEILTGEERAWVQVRGYAGASASYTLILERR